MAYTEHLAPQVSAFFLAVCLSVFLSVLLLMVREAGRLFKILLASADWPLPATPLASLTPSAAAAISQE